MIFLVLDLKYLVAKGADVNAVDNEGNTPLHVAARNNEHEDKENKLDIVKYFVGKGIDINVKNHDGKTALDIADDPDIIEYLNYVLVSN